MGQTYRLAVLNSHPIQYFAPLYRRLAQEQEVDIVVYYCHRQGSETYVDHGFGVAVQWDTPLLEGYCHEFLSNWRPSQHVGGFFSLVNPALIGKLAKSRPHALLVHGHAYFTYILGILAANLLGIPVFMRCETHLLLNRTAVKQSLRQPLMTLLYRRLCARCLAIGSRNRQFYASFGVPAQRIFDVPYVVDNDFFLSRASACRPQREAIRRAIGVNEDVPIILFASKLTPRKRPLDLLLAYHRLRQHSRQAALVFVGSGELEGALRSFVAERQTPDVHFLGFRNQSELPCLYAAADLFVLSSENEPWGLILNEVMCAGLPVVASDEIGAAPDLVHDGDNGFTFPAGDVDSLAERLATLIGDTALRDEMGRRSSEIISAWNLDRCAKGVLAALRSLEVDGTRIAHA